MPLLIFIIFIALFFSLSILKKPFFENKKMWLQIELAIIVLMTLIQIIISGLGMTTAFILLWVVFGFGFYYVYHKYNKKIGFIMVTFSLYFSIVFLLLQLWIFGTN